MRNAKKLLTTKLNSMYLTGFIVTMAGQITFAADNHGDNHLTQSAFVQALNTTEPGAVVAVQINQDNVAKLQRHGPDAIGGLGDWFFSNGTLCAVISDVSHESEFSSKGGALVDLGYCGRADDHITSTHDLIDGSRQRPLDGKHISIKALNGTPSIVVASEGDGAKLTTRYHFDSTYPNRLNISKRYQSAPGDDFSFISPLNFNLHSMEPFVFNSRDLEFSNGFNNEDFVERGTSAVRKAARRADTIIFPSPRSAKTSVSYGWQMRSAQRVSGDQRIDVPFFILADSQSTAMMVLTDTFYVGNGDQIGWLQLPQIPLLGLDENDAIETQEVLFVGQNGDVASITDQLLPDSPMVHGRIDDANSALHIQQKNGAPLTHIIPNSNGEFSFKAPAGDYTLTALGFGGRSVNTSFKVDKKDLSLEPIKLPVAAKLTLPRGHAMRLLFVGLDGHPDPDFSGELTNASVAFDDHVQKVDPISTIFLAGVDSDRAEVDIAAGKYLVYAIKGPEFSLEKVEIDLKKGEQKELIINPPRRIIDTPNHIASDLHVHSGISFDNAFSESERVRTFAAEHGEVMVASEHDVPTDYAPYIEALGVNDRIVAIPAVEITSILPTETNRYTGGHVNVFPFQPQHTHYRNGLFNHENNRLRDTIYSVRQRSAESIVQLNHPRHDMTLAGEDLPNDWAELIHDGNYLEHLGSAGHPYNAHHPLSDFPNSTLIEKHAETGVRDLDFDLVELINPAGKNNDSRIAAVRQDWLSFLKQGERIVGTANSDSHSAFEQVALPRTMVAMTDDSLAKFNLDEFVKNLKSGNAYGTTGPMLEISMLETSTLRTSMGGTFAGVRGTLTVTVSRVPWIKVDQLNIQINGDTVDTHRLSDSQQQTVKVPLEFDKDSFVTVEVFGPATEDYSMVYPDLKPYAFSNPIYVDFDQDGIWSAPGLTSESSHSH